MARVTKFGGDVVLEVYNSLNPKQAYKELRMHKVLGPLANAPFQAMWKKLSPFGPWNLEYDKYNHWPELRLWFLESGLGDITGRGLGFGYHRYLLHAFYLHAAAAKVAPVATKLYYDATLALERQFGGLPVVRAALEKLVIRGTKGPSPAARELQDKVFNRLEDTVQTLPVVERLPRQMLKRQQSGAGVKPATTGFIWNMRWRGSRRPKTARWIVEWRAVLASAGRAISSCAAGSRRIQRLRVTSYRRFSIARRI